MPQPALISGPPLVRTKTSDAVAEHILEMLFAGELRPGDRIDLDAMAERLGVSRVPIREALILLERDGLIDMPYHRGAFVAALDASSIREAFDLYGLLSALTSGRVAGSRDDALLAELERQAQLVASSSDAETFETAAREFRRLINLAAAGSRLRAMIKGFSGLLPVASRLSVERLVEAERRLVEAEITAIRDQDPDRARRAALTHVRLLGDYAVKTLISRGVIQDTDEPRANEEETMSLLQALDREDAA